MRSHKPRLQSRALEFLSSNTQDFIEVVSSANQQLANTQFLSSNTQDFIEVIQLRRVALIAQQSFLSSNTQDFIEVG